jgi:hypothetical protein
MALVFHNNEDLVEYRPNIFNYGVEDFTTQMEEAEAIISRAVDAKWYRNRATDYGLDWRVTTFDINKLVPSQLRRLAVYKSLSLIYLILMKDAANPDIFERQSETFKKMYTDELKEVLDSGLDYDWDEDSSISAGENIQPRIRRLMRM